MACLREAQGLLIPDWVLFYLAFMAGLAFSESHRFKSAGLDQKLVRFCTSGL